MKRKIVWLVVSSLMVLSLLAAACAPKVEEKIPAAPVTPAAPAAPAAPTAPTIKEAAPATPAKEMVKLTLTKLDGTRIEKLVEKPRYGGTFRIRNASPFVGYDPLVVMMHRAIPTNVVIDMLITGDWTRSPAGTDETNFWATLYYPAAFMGPALAESWEVPDSQTIIYHLRKGVKFHDKPPTSGREMTADDVKFSIELNYRTKTSVAFVNSLPEERPASITTPDKYTVVVKSQPGFHILAMHTLLASVIPIYPRDYVEKWGEGWKDWRKVMGTGAFQIVDVVEASSTTLIRNPNYWMKDPLHPENQLPYVDKIEWFIIPDKSTHIAALRTGKIDHGDLETIEDLEGLLKTRPDIQYKGIPDTTPEVIQFKDVTNPKSLWSDIRVRKALSMAIDRQTIIKDFFRGYADILPGPVAIIGEWISLGLYMPVEKHNETVREIFSYNSEKAKKLLAEAGYPKGFKTKIDISSASPADIDELIIIKEYWAAIGVDVEIKIREPAVFTAIEAPPHTQEALIFAYTPASNPYAFMDTLDPKMTANRGNIEDPYIIDLAKEIAALTYDEPAQLKLYKEKAYSYILEKVYQIYIPRPHIFRVWQPWVYNYYGVSAIGARQYNKYPIYTSIDQELKKALGY